MKSLHLSMMVFCHVLLASAVFYLAASMASASPLVVQPSQPSESQKSHQEVKQQRSPAEHHHHQSHHQVQPAEPAELAEPQKPVQVVAPGVPVAAPVVVVQHTPVLAPAPASKLEEKSSVVVVAAAAAKKEEQQFKSAPEAKIESVVAQAVEPRKDSVVAEYQSKAVAEKVAIEAEEKKPEAELEPKMMAPVLEKVSEKLLHKQAASVVAFETKPAKKEEPTVIEQRSQAASAKIESKIESAFKKDDKPIILAAPIAPATIEQKPQPVEKNEQQQQQPLQGKISEAVVVVAASKPVPPVNGGLGPLHLLATTLCSYQPDKPISGDEAIPQLYARRAAVRKSLFEFMSLKFTNLEKLSSRLGYDLPIQSVPDPTVTSVQSVQQKPSHGWPVVGQCTAHDLKLMSEAAWCECYESDQVDCAKTIAQQQQVAQPALVASPIQAAPVEQQQKPIIRQSRSIDGHDTFPPEQSSVMSKMLHVGDVKDAPIVESAPMYAPANLTGSQQLEAPTQECRRNALRYSKALFQHLAEDQQSQSESWPKLYAQISSDDCARKRMIDIVNALSSFRTDTTSIRRDNVEFAFAMDDLRTKVLESEVNVPLTFDRHFIEVEQFLQQSVRLMLASVQPKRAKLTSMRYRSLMYGAAANIDEQQQCIDLHQRLLAKNYPSQCNPTQFGQLPDVLRMTANSLELWSIDKELSSRLAKVAANYPSVAQQKVKEDVNECIANLVAN